MTRAMEHEQRYYLRLLEKNQHKVGGLYAAYKKPSARKIDAYYAIKRECVERGGYGLCVLTASAQYFTVGYFYPDAETGELRACIKLPTRTLDFAVVE